MESNATMTNEFESLDFDTGSLTLAITAPVHSLEALLVLVA
jgi:hypothetical protein